MPALRAYPPSLPPFPFRSSAAHLRKFAAIPTHTTAHNHHSYHTQRFPSLFVQTLNTFPTASRSLVHACIFAAIACLLVPIPYLLPSTCRLLPPTVLPPPVYPCPVTFKKCGVQLYIPNEKSSSGSHEHRPSKNTSSSWGHCQYGEW